MNIRLSLIMILAALFIFACKDVHINEQAYHSKKTIKKTVVIPPAPVLPDSVCVAAVGDIMMGTSYPNNNTLPPDSGKNSFANLTNELHSADVTFGNLEGTLLNTGAPAHYKLHLVSKAWLFRMPVSYGQVLKDAGFNLLSFSNVVSGRSIPSLFAP